MGQQEREPVVEFEAILLHLEEVLLLLVGPDGIDTA